MAVTSWGIRLAAMAGLGLFVLSAPVPAARAQDADMDAIFRCQAEDAAGKEVCRRGRELVLFQCGRCHNWVRIVIKQADETLWRAVVGRMRAYAPEITDEEAETIVAYVSQNFREGLPMPPIPDSLMEAEYPTSTTRGRPQQ